MTKKGELKLIRNNRIRKKRLEEKIAETWQSLLPKSPTLSDMPKSPSYEDMMALKQSQIYDMEQERFDEWFVIDAMEQKAKNDIARLSNPFMKTVIEMYYFDCMPTWYHVADALGYSDRQVFNLHGKALMELSKMETLQ